MSIFLNVVAGSSDDTAQVENVMSCLRSKSSYDISLAAGVKSKYVSYLATVTFKFNQKVIIKNPVMVVMAMISFAEHWILPFCQC